MYLFLLRFVYHDPVTQDPDIVCFFVVMALAAIGIGYLPALVRHSEEEEETRTAHISKAHQGGNECNKQVNGQCTLCGR